MKIFLQFVLVFFACYLPAKSLAQCSGTGAINYQRWNNITGTTISSLTGNANYPNSPSTAGTMTSFEIGSNTGSNYGVRMYGFLCAPTTGNYVFWIASDDNGELWMSTNSSSANKTRIAYHTAYTSSRQWTKYTTQKSATRALVAGQIYYIEALMKEGTGSDNLAVGWSKPGQSTSTASQVIPGSNLMIQITSDTQAPSAPTNLVSSNITESSVNLSWTASTDNLGVSGYDIYQNGIKLNSSLVTTTTYAVSALNSASAYSYFVRAKDAAGNTSANSNTVNINTLAVVNCSGTGTINYQTWNNITGTSIANLTTSANYPNSPTTSGTLTIFETTTNAADNYGTKVYGYLCPPTTGNYCFWIASDDNGELWLSTTNNAANKVRIAYHTTWTNSREWNKFATQKSAVIPLIAGQQYYIEALMKEGTGGDNLAVGWSKPGQATTIPSEVIPGNRLISTIQDAQPPSAPTNLIASNITPTTLSLNWTASTDNVGVTGYDIYQNGVKLNGSLVGATSYNVSSLTASTSYGFYIIAKDAAGNSSAQSNTVNVTTLPPPDTQSPSVPGNLNYTGLSQTSLTLNWEASTDNVGVTGYDVFRNGVKINSSTISGISYNVTGLSASTNYSFYVVAKDAAGNTANSSTLNITTPDTQAPTAPTNLASSNLSHIAFTLTWTASTDNVGVTGYNIYQDGIKINAVPVAPTSYNVTGLTPGTAYTFYVVALDAANNISLSSNNFNITTPDVPDTESPSAPTNLTSSNLTQSSLTLNWTASTDNVSVLGYDVYQNGVKINVANIAGTSYNVTGLSASTNYAFYVVARDAAGNTANSSTLNITTPDTQSPSAPANLTSSNLTQSSLTLTWTASIDNVGVTGYDVYQNAVKINGVNIAGTSYGVSGLSASTNYAFYVVAKDAVGNSANSNTLNIITPDTQAPGAPTNLTSSNLTQSSLTLSWTASTDNVGVSGYDVFRNGVKINGANIISTSYAVTGLSASTNYAFYVVAKDAAGNTANSSTLNITTPDTQAPTSPTNLASSNLGQTSFTLTWTASTDNVSVTGYDVYQNSVKINGSNITGTSYNVTGLTASTGYTFYLIAKDAAGNSSSPSTNLNVTTTTPTPGQEAFTQRTVISNQNFPHDLVYGPDGNLWYTERTGGTVNYVNIGSGAKTTLLTLGSAMVQSGGQDGLIGMALHPGLLTGKPYVYIVYTYQSVSATVKRTRIERYTYSGGTLGSPVTILQDIPGSNDHNAGRLAIGPDLKLYYSVGDMGSGQFDNASRTQNAQSINIYEGKILRLNTEQVAGSWIPTDNPFTNAGSPTAVYTLGHRNPQGLVWGNVNGTNRLYSDEHGPYSDDEVNVIEVGRNYGWPQVAGLCDGNYNGRTIGNFSVVSEQTNCTNLNVREPLKSLFPVANPPSGGDNMTWPSTAPSGADFYGSNAIPGWQNSLLIAQLKKGAMLRYKLSNDGLSIISDTIHYFKGLGRFRDVVVSPDGLKIYLSCDKTGSTSGPTGGVLTTPPNAGNILEFTYVQPSALIARNQPAKFKNAQETKDMTTDIYPNPASNYIVIYNYKNTTERMIELYNINGQLVRREKSNNTSTRMDLSDIQNGFYIIKIAENNGKVVRSEKVFIQK